MDEERRLDKSRGSFGDIKGIIGSEIVSSAQLKGAETMVAGIRGSTIGIDDSSEGVLSGNGGSVCVDMVTEDGGMSVEFV